MLEIGNEFQFATPLHISCTSLAVKWEQILASRISPSRAGSNAAANWNAKPVHISCTGLALNWERIIPSRISASMPCSNAAANWERNITEVQTGY